MKSKIIIGFFVMLVSTIMLMSNASGSGWPVIWWNQATISLINPQPSVDPENSGYGTTQVVVWEDWNGNDWDIWMKYNLFDGVPINWLFPAIQPAITAADEINPAVTVTGPDPVMGVTWIHVVFQRWNPANGGQWDVCHTFTTNFGAAWSPITVLDSIPLEDAIDPAIVYTEDTVTLLGTTMLAQIVWSEFNPVSGFYEIQYDAFFLDINRMPVTGYVGTFLIRGAATGATGDCFFPEIASVDETLAGGVGVSSFPFSVVWQEQTAAGQWNVWYDDGTTTTSPGLMVAMTPGSTGQLNAVNFIGDCYQPDIAVTQDYGLGAGAQIYYYHVNWIYNIWPGGGPATWQVDTCYWAGAPYNPGAAAFIATGAAQGPSQQNLANPSIASKLVSLNPTTIDTWMAWEDWTVGGATNPDIWFIVGSYSLAAFGYTSGSGRVGYVPPAGGGSTEWNPELWNRNDAARNFPPLTHLVFDQNLGPTWETEYIDP